MRWRTWRALSISPYVWVNLPAHFMIRPVIDEMEVLVGRCRLTVSKPVLTELMVSVLETETT